jgi:hypothetical protein
MPLASGAGPSIVAPPGRPSGRCMWITPDRVLYVGLLGAPSMRTGDPADSTHFSHSIRQVCGLKPSDIFAASRRLAIHAHAPRPL